MARTPEDIIAAATAEVGKMIPIAKESVVYRASIAYLLQHVRAFLAALQELKNKEFTPSEIQAVQRFIGLVGHFCTILPQLGDAHFTSILNWPSSHIHNYIDGFRKTLMEIAAQLSMDASVIKYEKGQDVVNKIADLQHMKKMLWSAQESKISVPNSVDVQQLIEVRLRSVEQHLRKKSPGRLSKQPSSDAVPVLDLQKKMDEALSVFTAIDIPCEELKLANPLGCGGFGTVYKATRLTTAEVLAVKEVRSDRLTMATWASLYSEVATMAELKHKYVLELVGAHIKEPYRIITRYCPGRSLFDRLHKSPEKQLTSRQLTAIAYQVAEGMRFLHSNGIVHRDLKTMNILLDDKGIAKIADFGLVGVIKEGEGLNGGVGTPHYTAPEILEKKRYGPKVDVYSFGVILWEMASRQIPYRDKTHQDIYEHVVTRGWRLPGSSSISEPMFELIKRCWSANPNERPDFTEIAELFSSRKVYFKGEKNSTAPLDLDEGCPPMDIPYLLSVLEDPSNKYFEGIAKFLAQHIDRRTVKLLRSKQVMSKYTAESDNASSVLLLGSCLLRDKDFPSFITSCAKPIIEKILKNGRPYDVMCALTFCLKVPDSEFDSVKGYTPDFVARISEPQVGPLVVRLVARGTMEEARKYKQDLIVYFDPNGVSSIRDNETLNALARIFPILAEDLSGFQLLQFIPLLELSLDIPTSFIELLVSKTSQDAGVRLILALIKAAYRTDVTDIMIAHLRTCDDKELEQFVQNLEVFDHIHRLLVENKSVKAALLLLFRLTMVTSISSILASHPILQAVLQVKGHTAQKLQIFTCLFSDEQFCMDTTVTDGIWKLLISSLNVERLSDYTLKLIGALSSHQTGRDMILDTGILSVFTEMFLTSASCDNSTSLTILSNMSTVTSDIPQVSLIISCLMQDLLSNAANQSQILKTLTSLIAISPASVQEHDLRHSVLPLISQRQEPVIIVLAMRLLESCDMTKLSGFYDMIAQRIYNVLASDNMMYPELLAAAIELITSLATDYDMTHFITATGFVSFAENILPQVASLEEIHREINNCVFALKRRIAESEKDEETKTEPPKAKPLKPRKESTSSTRDAVVDIQINVEDFEGSGEEEDGYEEESGDDSEENDEEEEESEASSSESGSSESDS